MEELREIELELLGLSLENLLFLLEENVCQECLEI